MSVIKLYNSNNWNLLPEKLFKLDNIGEFLATKNSTTIDDFQYQKNALEISIKLDANQINAQPTTRPSYKYVSILNDGENIAYYYVKRISWRSKNCIQLDLVMDVLNTFQEGVDYNFKANTRIIREHKNRFATGLFTFKLVIATLIGGQGAVKDGDLTTLQYEDPMEGWTNIAQVKIVSSTSDSFTITPVNNEDILVIKQTLEEQVPYTTIRLYETAFIYIEANFAYPIEYHMQLNRNIDYISENIAPLLVCNDIKGNLLEDVSPLNQNWFLLYRNANNPDPADLTNPVNCYLVTEKATKVNTGVVDVGNVVYASSLREDAYYYVKLETGMQITAQPSGTNFTKVSGFQTYVEIHRTGANEFSIRLGTRISSTFTWFIGYYKNNQTSFELSSLPFPYIVSGEQIPSANIVSSLFDNPNYWDVQGSEVTTDSITALDRTDPKNIKLIKLPYCPFKFETTEDTIVDDGSHFEFVTLVQGDGSNIKCFKLDDLNTRLANTLENEDINPFNDFIVTEEDFPSINDLRVKYQDLESKLYNSEFHQPKLVYDSFIYNFELEKMAQNNYYEKYNCRLSLEFVMTKTINSRFMFRATNLLMDKAESNYPDVMVVSRNNEEVLYNSPYINYIRTGFNYDVKNKNIANVSNWAGVGLSGVSTIASLALPSIPLKIAGVVGSLVSMALSVKNAVVSTINSENTIKQKLFQEQNRTASVSGCDDIDLMSEYTGNRLKYVVYNPTSIMKNMLENLFFYAGYASGRMGIPSHNNRINFDYLEAEVNLEQINANMSIEILDELKNAFKVGVTYIHKTNRLPANSPWDLEQKFENWETNLL